MMSAGALGSVGRDLTVWVEVVHHSLAPKDGARILLRHVPSSFNALREYRRLFSKTGKVLGRVPMKALRSAGDNFLRLRRDCR